MISRGHHFVLSPRRRCAAGFRHVARAGTGNAVAAIFGENRRGSETGNESLHGAGTWKRIEESVIDAENVIGCGEESEKTWGERNKYDYLIVESVSFAGCISHTTTYRLIIRLTDAKVIKNYFIASNLKSQQEHARGVLVGHFF